MVFVLPCSGGAFQSLDLAETHQLLLGRLRKECAAASFADQGVDLHDQLLGDDDVGSFGVHKIENYVVTA